MPIKKHQALKLKAVFDTSVLFTKVASDLVNEQAAELIKQKTEADLDITWFLVDTVRHERQYQMLNKALEFLPSIEKLERLLGHNLNITEDILTTRVEEAVKKHEKELGLVRLSLDSDRVDWNKLAIDAVYRRPPFQSGQTEKGFKDALILETFAQLVEDSPATPTVCQVCLVADDVGLLEAAKARTSARNVHVIRNLAELRELINTLSSEVKEDFIAEVRPKAARLFFPDEDAEGLYYKKQVRKLIEVTPLWWTVSSLGL